jgi:hypothetical protein
MRVCALAEFVTAQRMQTAAPGTFNGMLDCAGTLMRNEGPLAFYNGTLTPLLGIGLCVSIQFGAVERTKRFFVERNRERGVGGPDGSVLTGSQLAAAGLAAGWANSVVSGPVEHIRIRESACLSATPCSMRSADRTANPVGEEPGVPRPAGRVQEDLRQPRHPRDLQGPGRDALPRGGRVLNLLLDVRKARAARDAREGH